MDKHINVISVLWIVYGGLGMLAAFVAFWILFGVTFIPDIGIEATYILRGVAIFIGVLVAVFSIPEVIAGFGLQKKKEWARILTLVLCFLNLVSFPLGTALSIYSFVILIKDETIMLFQK
ncbi:MAG: hypothetical protein JXB23_08635 [Candidatus Aminicenantes bacterium]|nr:hypothetical protein [Candidatus Aminicenantes bacterium]